MKTRESDASCGTGTKGHISTKPIRKRVSPVHNEDFVEERIPHRTTEELLTQLKNLEALNSSLVY